MLFIIRPYWTGSGLSRPNWARISWMTCALGLRPAMARAGSTPGVLKKITNTTTVMTNMTSTVASRRRTMKVSMAASALHSHLGARVEGVPHPVAEHIEGEDGEQDHDAGGERVPRPGVEQAGAVLDHRPPADVGRLDADRQEGQRRRGQDGGGDYQREQHDHGGDHVGQDLREDQPQVARALGDRGLHELLLD